MTIEKKQIWRAIQVCMLLNIGMMPKSAMTDADLAANNKEFLQLGEVAYRGSGCPDGSVKVSYNRRKNDILLVFQRYQLELKKASGPKGRNKETVSQDKSCSVVIPLNVPDGTSISLESAHYDGVIDLKDFMEVRLVNDYSFDGKRGRRFRTIFHGPTSHQYNLTDTLSAFAGVWTACGEDTELRLSLAMRISDTARGRNKKDSSKARVGKVRFRRGMTTHLKTRQCSDSNRIATAVVDR